ncbi:hypothetical protein GOODEAATRI_020100, partial [Goodea atripinnis]
MVENMLVDARKVFQLLLPHYLRDLKTLQLFRSWQSVNLFWQFLGNHHVGPMDPKSAEISITVGRGKHKTRRKNNGWRGIGRDEIQWRQKNRDDGKQHKRRYKLLRRKTHQPLAVAMVPTLTATSPPPSEDLHRWLHVYSGTKLFYEDKGLSRFTYYQYQLTVYNDVGYTSGDIVTAVTMAGVPLKPPTLSAHAINHTAVQVNWNKP